MAGLGRIIERLGRRGRRDHVVYNDDVFLVSFPKSGNTWLAFMLANVLAIQAGRPGSVNFYTIQDYVPEYDADAFALRPDGIAGYPRIIKSHRSCTPAFPKAILLVRDPRDVMVSYFHYLRGLRRIPETAAVGELIRSARHGVDAWVSHTEGWLERADAGRRVRVLRYEDLLANPPGELARLFELMGRPVGQAVLDEAVRRSGKETMRALEQATRSPDYPLRASDFSFVRSAQAGEGRTLPEPDRRYVETRAAALMDVLGYPRG